MPSAQPNTNVMNKVKEELRAWLGPVPVLSLIFLVVVFVVLFSWSGNKPSLATSSSEKHQEKSLDELVVPSEGIVLPIKWGDLGVELTESGTIDKKKFIRLYEGRGGLSADDLALLESGNNGKIIMTRENSGYILNLLWAFGLANKNPILEEGPMSNPSYGGAGAFASTGGWTLARGNAMDHYSMHNFVTLSADQQSMVEEVSKGIYRPCCGNSTHFPDCNHGMAMLGLLEILASQGLSESEMYDIALKVNSYWFPETYVTIASYFEGQGVDWENVNAREVLGYNYSSGAGYRDVLSKINPVEVQGGGGCSA